MRYVAESGGTVVVTGASCDLGAGFARRLAARGCDLVLVTRRRDRLDHMAEDLATQHGVSVTVLAADLSAPGAVEALVTELDATGAPRVSGPINSAGFGTAFPLADESAERVRDESQVNVAAPTLLTRALLPKFFDAAFRGLDRGPVAGPVLTVGRTNRVRGWLGRVAPRRPRLRIAADLAAKGGRR